MLSEKEILNEKSKYTRKIEIPIYEPKNEMPEVFQLYNKDKCNYLSERIKKSDIPEDIKQFLYSAAERHTTFDFSKIADFYAHSDIKIKRLFEESALVIIDYDAAIREGFISFQKCVDEDMEKYINSLSPEELDQNLQEIKNKFENKKVFEELF